MNRILLRNLNQKDLPDFLEMIQDSEVMKFIGPRYRGLTLDEAQEAFQGEISSPSRYVVALKSTDEFIGLCGIKFFDGIPDFAVFLRRKFWGQGYASEACRAAAENLKDQIAPDQIEVFILKANQASLALAKKMGWVPQEEAIRENELGYVLKSQEESS